MMKKILVGILIGVLLLFSYVLNIFYSTGYFRQIENSTSLEIVKKIEIPGAEDITISQQDHFALISSDDRAARRDGNGYSGGIYFIDLEDAVYVPHLISSGFDKAFNPHGISLFPIDSGLYQLMVINHVDDAHSIEVFELRDQKLTHRKTLVDKSMVSPNDLVIINETQFYFTNDHGYTSRVGIFLENYLGLSVSNVVFYDGQQYKEVADGIAYANGINYDKKRSLLYVASPRDFKINVYNMKSDFSLEYADAIEVETGADNIELDEHGNLWTGAHPNLMAFTAFASGRKESAPSEVIKIAYRGYQDYSINSILVDDGQLLSASSVAAPYKNLILIGNVLDTHFLITELK